MMNKKVNRCVSLLTGIVATIGLGALSSCDDLDKIKFDLTMPVVFAVAETETNSGGKDYEVTALLDISQNPDVISYINRLEEIKVNHIEYSVSNADLEDISLNEATITTSGGFSIVKDLTIPLSNSSSGQFELNAPGVNDLATRLIGNEKDELHLSGFLTRTPLTCNVTITFHLSIKARAI
ncbi:MAG: hypothetical protein E6Q96_02840 [Cyclobacteriaceae bacterium]|nr:MAG: hypothetical protein E6Q96_02840 [Cyclobacteriaceae bacterium]